MSRGRFVYSANLVPINRIVDPIGRDAHWRFDQFTFHQQRADPIAIPVTWRHPSVVGQDPERRIVGHLVELLPGSTWWRCRFVVDPARTVAVVADELLDIGTPVSVGFVEQIARHHELADVTHHVAAELFEVAVVPHDGGAVAGAEIIGIDWQENAHIPRDADVGNGAPVGGRRPPRHPRPGRSPVLTSTSGSASPSWQPWGVLVRNSGWVLRIK